MRSFNSPGNSPFGHNFWISTSVLQSLVFFAWRTNHQYYLESLNVLLVVSQDSIRETLPLNFSTPSFPKFPKLGFNLLHIIFRFKKYDKRFFKDITKQGMIEIKGHQWNSTIHHIPRQPEILLAKGFSKYKHEFYVL